MQMTKKVLSIVLAVMMVVSMMSVMAVTANAAPSDFSSDTKTVFVTDSQGWDSTGDLQAYYWRVDTTYDAQYNAIETEVAGDWVATTRLYDNSMSQTVYGVVIPDDANRILFKQNNSSTQTSDTTNVYNGSWWYIDGNKKCQPCSGDVFETSEQTDSLSDDFVGNTGADRYYVLDGHYYFVSPTDGKIYSYDTTSELMVAEVVGGTNNGQKFTSVNDAVAAAGEGGEVKLINDIKSNVGIDGDYTTTLDLNGFTITNTSGSGITLYSKYHGDKTFTIKDTSAAQSGAIVINKKYDGDGCISDSSGRKVVIEGGSYTSNGNALYISSDNGWEINGGTFDGNIKVVSEVEINGGVITGNINATGPSWKVDPAEVTISGGSINGSLNSENGSTFEVSGGTFSEAVPEEYCASGYIPTSDGNGNYGVKTGSYVVQIGATKYESFADAFAAANDGDTVKVLDDVNIGTSYYYVTKDITIDLNNKTVTGADTFFIADGAEVEISNGTVTSSVANDYVLYAKNGGKLIIADDAVIQATNAKGNAIIVRTGSSLDVYGTIESGYYSIAGFGTAVVNVYDGASITSTSASCISGNGSGGNEGYTFNVMGGTLTSTNDVAIYHPNQGTLNITGGTITGATAIYIKSGDTDVSTSGTSINGATIRGTGAQSAMVHSGNGCNATGDAIVIENCGYPGGTPSIGISGGTIVSDNAQDVGSYAYNADSSTNYEPITGFVSGGAFGHVVPEEQCADGFKPVTTANAQGKYEVTTKTLQEYADTATSGITGLQFVDNTSTDNFTNAFEASLLGVQLRKNNVEYEDTYGSNDLRYIAAVKKTFLATLDNYGFAFSNDGTHYTEVSCKGTKNTVITAGQDDKYEYFTAALKNIPDSAKGQKLYVKFYVKDGNDTAYAKYTKVNPQDTHQIIASYNDVVTAANGN